MVMINSFMVVAFQQSNTYPKISIGCARLQKPAMLAGKFGGRTITFLHRRRTRLESSTGISSKNDLDDTVSSLNHKGRNGEFTPFRETVNTVLDSLEFVFLLTRQLQHRRPGI